VLVRRENRQQLRAGTDPQQHAASDEDAQHGFHREVVARGSQNEGSDRPRGLHGHQGAPRALTGLTRFRPEAAELDGEAVAGGEGVPEGGLGASRLGAKQARLVIFAALVLANAHADELHAALELGEEIHELRCLVVERELGESRALHRVARLAVRERPRPRRVRVDVVRAQRHNPQFNIDR